MLIDLGEARFALANQRGDILVIFAAVADRLFEDRRIGGDAGHSVLFDQPREPALGEETPVEEVEPYRLPFGLERVQSIGHHSFSALITRRATLTTLCNGEAELLLELRKRSGRAECAHGHGRAGGPDIAVPAERARLLHRDAGADRRRQHRVAIALRLLFEQSPGRHRHDARADALGGELFVRAERQRNLAAGGEQEQFGIAAVGIGQHIGAFGQLIGRGVTAAVDRRQLLAREDDAARHPGLRHRHPPGFARFRWRRRAG